MSKKIIGRTAEIKLLKEALASEEAEMVSIIGRRFFQKRKFNNLRIG